MNVAMACSAVKMLEIRYFSRYISLKRTFGEQEQSTHKTPRKNNTTEHNNESTDAHETDVQLLKDPVKMLSNRK